MSLKKEYVLKSSQSRCLSIPLLLFAVGMAGSLRGSPNLTIMAEPGNSNAVVEVGFLSESNYAYNLLGSTNLTNEWGVLQSNVTGTGVLLSLVDTNSSHAYFYRLESWLAANVAPAFDQVVYNLADGNEDYFYSASLYDRGTDLNPDRLSYRKIGGPAWISMAHNGYLIGTPTLGDVGTNTFMVEVSDGVLTDTAQVNIVVHPKPAEASGLEILLSADEDSSSASGYGGSVLNTVNDPFAYDPVSPAGTLPVQAYTASTGFHGQNPEGTDITLVYNLAGGATTVPAGQYLAIDLYGRRNPNNNNAGVLAPRDNDIDLRLYSGGLAGTLVASTNGVAIDDSTSNSRVLISMAGAFDTLELIGHDSVPADGYNLFTLMEIRMAAVTVPEEIFLFEPNWASLSPMGAPEWLEDAKFGIYTHWGPQTYFSEITGDRGYYNNLYNPAKASFTYHAQNYGNQLDVGYKDVIGEFTAPNFDAEQWAEIFYNAGARFGGMVVLHHDHVAHWNSSVNPFNMYERGPELDLTLELMKAYRAKGMYFLTTFHHLGSWERSFLHSYTYDGQFPENVEIYNEPHVAGDPPSAAFKQRGIDAVHEAYTLFESDGIWFDYGLGLVYDNSEIQQLAADYYNWALANGKIDDVCFIKKNGSIQTGITDAERGRTGKLEKAFWMNDDSISTAWWYYTGDDSSLVPGYHWVHAFADIVSKNGSLLLNIAPDRNGDISTAQLQVLDTLGDWLDMYGESIYSTRSWENYGEGPFQLTYPGRISNKEASFWAYSNEDIRFTRSKDGQTIYAIFLGEPKDGIVIDSMTVTNATALNQAIWIGKGPVTLDVNADSRPVLRTTGIDTSDAPTQIGFAIAIPADAVEYDSTWFDQQPAPVDLIVEDAVLYGSSLSLIQIDDDLGIRAIGNWENAADHAEWAADLPNAGVWQIEGDFHTRNTSEISATLDGHTVQATLRDTGVGDVDTFILGTVTVASGGTKTVTIQPVSGATWDPPVQLYGVTLRYLGDGQ